MAPRKKQAGKRKDQAPPEAEPSKQPKGATASVRREREKVVQEAGGPARQQKKEARKQAKAHALAQAYAHVMTRISTVGAAAHSVDLLEGAPGAIPVVQAASSPIAPDLEDGSADSLGEQLSESKFADEEEDVVLLREPTVPKGKKKNVKGPLWSDCRFGDVVPVEFPGGPKNKDVLSSYGSHIARYVYKGFDRVKLTSISHGRKLRVFNKTLLKEAWFTDRIAKTSLADLPKTGHMMVDPFLISAFVERWHEETSSFHIPAGR
ncbi:hypothetical protein P8452_61734 [Trifolium repens]|nr:hypothetical protein P8452_61734 [Trifolium repens]